MLYVYETVELELAMTQPELPDFDDLDPDDAEPESFSCNIKLLKGCNWFAEWLKHRSVYHLAFFFVDPMCLDRYHCFHAAGVHTVALPWQARFRRFYDDGESSLFCTSSRDVYG